MHKYFLSLIIILSFTFGYGQDATVSAKISPVNGCNHTANEVVNVIVLNTGSAPIFSGTLVAKYQVNGGTIQTESLSTNIPGGGGNTWNCNFSVKADLSACDTDFHIKAWVESAGDPNPANDTLSWVVRNDCTVVPGQVVTDATVCSGNNNNTLNLTGWSHGSIANWIYSEDNGATWNSVSNTTPSESPSNLTQTREYAVAIDGGYCVNDTSAYATLTVQPNPIGGILDTPADSLCITNAAGAIHLTGNNQPVLNWQSSTNNGITWTNIANVSTSQNFIGITQTTLYRAKIDGGVCPDVYSDTMQIYVEQASVAGVLKKDTLLCKNDDVDLNLVGSTGTVYDWQSSVDGTNWNPASGNPQGTLYNTGSLTTSTYYKVNVTNGICGSDLSNQVYVQIQQPKDGGTISGDTNVCAANANGSLTLTMNTGNVLNWESSTDNGASWIPISNTTTSNLYSSIGQTTLYRAKIDGEVCPDVYSDTAAVIVSPVSDAGAINGKNSVCLGRADSLYLLNNVGGVIKWQYSTDGNTWMDLSSNDSSHIVHPVDQPYYYRVIVKSGVCDDDTTSLFMIDTLMPPVANAGPDVTIYEGDSTQLDGSGGSFGVWTPGGSLSDSTIYHPIASPDETTTYTLYVVGMNGCFAKDEVTISSGNPVPPFDVKNVITPNKDGYNDTWFIQGWQKFPSISVYVYNIYGQEVYSNKDYKNDWAGEYKGKPLPDGTYMYVVKPEGSKSVYKGNLTILGNEK